MSKLSPHTSCHILAFSPRTIYHLTPHKTTSTHHTHYHSHSLYTLPHTTYALLPLAFTFCHLPAFPSHTTTSQPSLLTPPPPSLPFSHHHLPPYLTGLKRTQWKNRGQKSVTRPLIGTYDTSDVAIQERRRQQQRFREAQLIQREMSQLDRQYEELEEVGRNIEQCMRDAEGSEL